MVQPKYLCVIAKRYENYIFKQMRCYSAEYKSGPTFLRSPPKTVTIAGGWYFYS